MKQKKNGTPDKRYFPNHVRKKPMRKAHFVEDDILARENHKYKKQKFPMLTVLVAEGIAGIFMGSWTISLFLWVKFGLAHFAFMLNSVSIFILIWYAIYKSPIGRKLKRKELL